jgi:hypothetical protein
LLDLVRGEDGGHPVDEPWDVRTAGDLVVRRLQWPWSNPAEPQWPAR